MIYNYYKDKNITFFMQNSFSRYLYPSNAMEYWKYSCFYTVAYYLLRLSTQWKTLQDIAGNDQE